MSSLMPSQASAVTTSDRASSSPSPTTLKPCTSSTSTTLRSTFHALSQQLSKRIEDENDGLWNDYQVLTRDIMTRDRVVKKCKADLLPAVQEYLLDRSSLVNNNAMDENNEDDNTLSNNNNMNHFRERAREHYQAFCDGRGLDDAAQTQYLERCLGYTADWCAKQQLVRQAVVAWCKLRQTAFIPRQNTLATFLFIFSLSPLEKNDHDDDKDALLAQAALADVATFHDACFAPNERTVFLRIKSLLKQGDTEAAQNLLLHAVPQELQRLRTFTPLLAHYCQDDTTFASSTTAAQSLRLFRYMREAPGVHLDAETYVMLLSGLARKGLLFGSSAAATDNDMTMMQEAGFPNTGPALLDDLATEMSDDLLEFNETTALTLYQSLWQAAFSTDDNGFDAPLEEVLPTTLPFATTETLPNRAGEITMGRVTIDPTTCKCPATKAELQLFSLTTDQRNRVQATLLQMAATQHEDFAAKMRQRKKQRQTTATTPESSSGQYALEQLSTFVDWVAQRNFTAIVDGPNIAYFGHAVLHYSQVARMVDRLERLGERPLVIMPHKYCQPSFYVATIGRNQTLSDRDLQVIADLKAKDQFYTVPEWCLDDYYWMIASVVMAQKGTGVSRNTDDRNGALPGLRPLLITNDQMRDHRMDLLEPRLFRRWTSCHVVRYNFAPYDKGGDDEWEADRKVFLEHADSFSREIQGNPITTTIANGGVATTTTAWHIPIAEWNQDDDHNDRFCISIAAPPSPSDS